ncbi:MAG: FAD-binding oxidoreductase, partial [archaeon]|nr:FAD-binding oxidoreductase [archaeon]
MVEFKTKISNILDYPAPENGATRVFECPIPDGIEMPYLPGQFAMISHPEVKLLANPTQTKWASYSISSSPTQNEKLEFCLGGGSPTGVTHRLMQAKEGEEIAIRGPFGKFILEEDAPEYVMLATGTGIAPIISMTRTLLAKGKTVPISLYFGFRFPGQFMYREELLALQEQYPHFHYYPIASRPEDSWGFAKGHIQDVLKDYHSPSSNQAKVYICGKPAIAEELVTFCQETLH